MKMEHVLRQASLSPLLLSTFCLCLHSLALAKRDEGTGCQIGYSFQMSYSILQWREIKRGEKRRRKKKQGLRGERRRGACRVPGRAEFDGSGLGNASKKENRVPEAGEEGSRH